MFLDNPKVLYLIKLELDKSIEKYDKEKVLVFCLAMSYKLKKPAGVILVGPPAGGKSNLLNAVMQYFPVSHDVEEARKLKHGIILTGLSKKALNYFVPPGETWDHKLLCIQELDGAAEAGAVLRTFISEGMASTIIVEESRGRHFASSFNVQGTPAFFVTTANDMLEAQFASRLNVIEIGGEYVSEVLQYEAKKYSNGSTKKIGVELKLRKEVMSVPNEGDVLVPYAMKISDFWYKDTVIAQRSFPEFMKLIQSICILHSKFRKRANGVLVANMDDYEIARRISKISKFKLGVGLLRAYKKITAALLGKDEKYSHYLKDGLKARGMTREQLSELIERSMPQIDRYLEALCDIGVMKTHLRYVEDESDIPLKLGRNPNVYSLAISTEEDIVFPFPRKLLGLFDEIKDYSYFFENEGWVLKKDVSGIPLFHHPYNPITGEDIDVLKEEDVYMVEREREVKQGTLEEKG